MSEENWTYGALPEKEAAEPASIDYKLLLQKYMELVRYCEGTTFVIYAGPGPVSSGDGSDGMVFTEAEVSELDRLDALDRLER